MSYDRLTLHNAALVLVDQQAGLLTSVHDQTLSEYIASVTALVKLAKAFNLPTVITACSADSPNGPILPVITETLPDVPIVRRSGEINAWDNTAFVRAVKKTGRKKLIVAGGSTEVSVAFVALSAIRDGYDVYAVIDCSGTWSKLAQQVAVARMAQFGIVPVTWTAVGAELQADWRNTTDQELCILMSEHLPPCGNLFGGFSAVEGAAKA